MTNFQQKLKISYGFAIVVSYKKSLKFKCV